MRTIPATTVMAISVVGLHRKHATLTDRIRQSAETLSALLAEAHDRRAWTALGYQTFKAYVETEFGMSRGHAYRLLDQAKVIHALTEVAGVSDPRHLDITMEKASDLKPHLNVVARNVADGEES